MTTAQRGLRDRRLTTDDGTRITYRTGGHAGGADDAAALVFVHGWCSNLTHWQSQLEYFAPCRRVVALDRRGHGRSGVPDRGYTAARHARDLRAVVERERLAEVVVVGHAGGGPTVLAFADAHPELVAAVVLVDTHVSPRTTMGRPRSAQRSPLGRLVDSLAGSDGAATFEQMYRGFFSPLAGAAGERAVRDALRVPLRVARAELSSLAVDTEAMARRLRCPALWLTVEAADEARLSSIFADVSFGRVVGSGHFPHVEVPHQVNAMVDRFLTMLDAARHD